MAFRNWLSSEFHFVLYLYFFLIYIYIYSYYLPTQQMYLRIHMHHSEREILHHFIHSLKYELISAMKKKKKRKEKERQKSYAMNVSEYDTITNG